MTDFDLDAPATLKWISKEVAKERRLNSVKDAVRVAMKELNRTEFFSAQVACAGHVFRGDQIVEIFQTGRIAPRRHAAF